jgi:hypothetical protein
VSSQRRLNVFVNVPFDAAYEPLFEALVFTVFACGYRVRCALGERYKLPAYLSDLGGNDPDAHENQPEKVIRIVRNYLQRSPRGGVLAGPTKLATDFATFKARLPAIARGIDFAANEVRGYADYPTFAWCVAKFLTEPGTDDGS